MSAEALIRRKGILVNVERPTFTKDAAGSPVPSYAAHLSGVRLFVQPQSGAEAVRYGRETPRGFVVCYGKAGLDIQEKDRITGGELGSRVLDVQFVRTPGEITRGRIAHMVIECEETDSGG